VLIFSQTAPINAFLVSKDLMHKFSFT